MTFIQVKGATHLEICRHMYRHEKAVAEALAKHVAALLTTMNNHPADWRTIYQATHVRVANENKGKT